MDLLKGNVGPEANYDLELVGGKVKLSVGYQGAEIGVSVSAIVEPALFLEKLKAVIPGKLDDTVIDMLESALKAT